MIWKFQVYGVDFITYAIAERRNTQGHILIFSSSNFVVGKFFFIWNLFCSREERREVPFPLPGLDRSPLLLCFLHICCTLEFCPWAGVHFCSSSLRDVVLWSLCLQFLPNCEIHNSDKVSSIRSQGFFFKSLLLPWWAPWYTHRLRNTREFLWQFYLRWSFPVFLAFFEASWEHQVQLGSGGVQGTSSSLMDAGMRCFPETFR